MGDNWDLGPVHPRLDGDEHYGVGVTGDASAEGRRLSDVLDDADRTVRSGQAFAARTWRVGFDPLDTYLGGGVRAGELILLGGPQGLGKTTLALQMARNVVAAGGSATYMCFEHGERELLERLIALEAALLGGGDPIGLTRVRAAMKETQARPGGLEELLAGVGRGSEAVAAVASYATRLRLVRGTSQVDVPALARMIGTAGSEQSVVFVDYLQKVAVPDVADEPERVTRIVEALKDLALEHAVPVIAVVAADRAGISGGRTRLHHLRGSSALAYEADVALLLNDKYGIVARHHLVYDPAAANRFRNWVVCSIEKNRSGLDQIDLEFRKRFEDGCFDPEGAPVTEQLIDDRVYVE